MLFSIGTHLICYLPVKCQVISKIINNNYINSTINHMDNELHYHYFLFAHKNIGYCLFKHKLR